jgi:hypothetical protein
MRLSYHLLTGTLFKGSSSDETKFFGVADVSAEPVFFEPLIWATLPAWQFKLISRNKINNDLSAMMYS